MTMMMQPPDGAVAEDLPAATIDRIFAIPLGPAYFVVEATLEGRESDRAHAL